MAKITVVMEFDFDGFSNLSDEDKFGAIEAVLDSGAESTNSEILVKSIELN